MCWDENDVLSFEGGFDVGILFVLLLLLPMPFVVRIFPLLLCGGGIFSLFLVFVFPSPFLARVLCLLRTGDENHGVLHYPENLMDGGSLGVKGDERNLGGAMMVPAETDSLGTVDEALD